MHPSFRMKSPPKRRVSFFPANQKGGFRYNDGKVPNCTSRIDFIIKKLNKKQNYFPIDKPEFQSAKSLPLCFTCREENTGGHVPKKKKRLSGSSAKNKSEGFGKGGGHVSRREDQTTCLRGKGDTTELQTGGKSWPNHSRGFLIFFFDSSKSDLEFSL